MQSAVQTKNSKESSGICFSREDKADLHFAYGPDGNRLSKKAVYGNDSTVWTFYVRDVKGNIYATYSYKEGGSEYYLRTQSIFGRARIGLNQIKKGIIQTPIPFTTSRNGIYARIRGNKRYEIVSPHGNVLTLISDKREKSECADTLVKGYWPNIISASDYFIFGMEQPSRGTQSDYIFSFQGQVNIKEWNESIVGFKHRVEDARIGRFLSVDPISGQFAFNSPYAFCENQPVSFIELEGLEKVHFGRNDIVDISASSEDVVRELFESRGCNYDSDWFDPNDKGDDNTHWQVYNHIHGTEIYMYSSEKVFNEGGSLQYFSDIQRTPWQAFKAFDEGLSGKEGFYNHGWKLMALTASSVLSLGGSLVATSSVVTTGSTILNSASWVFTLDDFTRINSGELTFLEEVMADELGLGVDGINYLRTAKLAITVINYKTNVVRISGKLQNGDSFLIGVDMLNKTVTEGTTIFSSDGPVEKDPRFNEEATE